MRSIEPVLFTRLMFLPPAIRDDLLEYFGSARIPERQIEKMIDEIVAEQSLKDKADRTNDVQ
jgi:hypothetical protein